MKDLRDLKDLTIHDVKPVSATQQVNLRTQQVNLRTQQVNLRTQQVNLRTQQVNLRKVVEHHVEDRDGDRFS